MEFIPVFGWLHEILRWILASAITAFVTAVLVLLRADSGTAGIIYLVLVVWSATLAGRAISIYLAVIASFLFDYYFLEPLHSIGLSGFQSWLAMVAFVVACVVVGRVAERARRQTRQAERRREDVERLYSLSQEMMLHEDAAGLIREIPRLVEHNFALNAVLLYVRDEDQLYSSVPSISVRGKSETFSPETMRQALQEVSAASEPKFELPQGYTPMNLVFGMNSVGTLAWKPATLSREVATSVAAQVAIAITRAHAIEASARLEAARAADRLRTALIDSLTHELRTPLTAIRAAATTLLDGHGLDEATRYELATIVDEESSRLDSLIGEAMEVAEIEADGIRVRPEPLHTGTFLEQAVEESHDQLATHRVTIIVQQPDNPVWFDPHVIGRVLRHLLENAARYTPPNSRIVLRSRRSLGKVEFLVEDDGPGIDPHDLPLIFDKFYRGKQSVTTAKGSGMGLSITRALMTAHGGAIDVESTPGRGTTFRIWIPLVEKSPNAGAVAEAETSPSDQGQGTTVPAATKEAAHSVATLATAAMHPFRRKSDPV
ncbi:sensor histidine kinase [Acidicapsa acidisoli]|uniref:sensor histidine kinase n=1 Tax=Acidicapsa acidisoli TaxID=1615681 RepID=UPI0021DFB1CA|nr:ATP-binding protein [Acidicapsa acidisoli]